MRELQSQPLEGDRVVTGNDALLLDAQDLGQLLRVGGDKGAVLNRGRPGEAGIVSRQIGLCDKAVGGLDISPAGQYQFLRQSVLRSGPWLQANRLEYVRCRADRAPGQPGSSESCRQPRRP